MADDAEAIHAAELKKKRQFRKYAYRGVDLEDLLDKSSEEVNHHSPLEKTCH
jgi:small subunit ribosomal protein S15e